MKEINRRNFLTKTAVAGASVGLAGTGMLAACSSPTENTTAAQSVEKGANTAIQPLEVNSPMAKWKNSQPLDFVESATKRFSFPNWQSGNEDSIYYNLNIPAYFKSRVVESPAEYRLLERAISPDIPNLTFTDHEGNTTPPLKEYLVGKRQVQAMMMAHKGKVVFETYPGMNHTDYHVWMSASKTTVGLLVSMLIDEGKVDPEKPVSTYVSELKGSAWDTISVKNTMNMSVAVDNEETMESLSSPKSWISSFFTSVFGVGGGDPSEWRKMLKNVTPLPNEKPGDRFRYSTSNTQVLVLLTEQVTQMPWEAYWYDRVWSKIGARYPFIIGLTPDGTPVGGGLNFTTPEDMLHYALLYTPSWKAVAKEEVISDNLLKLIQNMGNHDAYVVSTELEYGTHWFGETPYMNTAQWDHSFQDGAMFKHGNMGQGIYVDPARDFCGMYFGLASNDDNISGIDHSPGYLRAAAKLLAGK